MENLLWDWGWSREVGSRRLSALYNATTVRLPTCLCAAKVTEQAGGLMEARRAWVGQEVH